MEPEYNEKLVTLEKILHDGIEKLLTHAREKNFIDRPYGRLRNPTPLITEGEFLANGGLDANDEDPQFVFEYGFDPLRFLGEYLQWAHPDSVQSRKDAKTSAVEYLKTRREHAQKQLKTFEELKRKVEVKKSGIQWGPFSSPISSTSVLFICKPFKPCNMELEMSKKPDFSEVDRVVTVVGAGLNFEQQNLFLSEKELDWSGLRWSEITAVKIVLDNLEPATRYYLRCVAKPLEKIKKIEKVESTDEMDDNIVENNSELEKKTQEPEVNTERVFYNLSSFWTLPSKRPIYKENEEEHEKEGTEKENSENNPVNLLCIGQLPIKEYSNEKNKSLSLPVQEPCDGINPHHNPTVTCILGELNLMEEGLKDYQSKADSMLNSIETLYEICPFFFSPRNQDSVGIFRKTSLLLGWYDGSPSSGLDLVREEQQYRLHRQEMRRYLRKNSQALEQSTGRRSTKRATKITPNNQKGEGSNLPPAPMLQRPPLPQSLSSLLQAFPCSWEDLTDPQFFNAWQRNPDNKSAFITQQTPETNLEPTELEEVNPEDYPGCRMLYRSLNLGPQVKLFLLDERSFPEPEKAQIIPEIRLGDYLGKEQTSWLKTQLKKDKTPWKLVLCGNSVGTLSLVEVKKLQNELKEEGYSGGSDGVLEEKEGALGVDEPDSAKFEEKEHIGPPQGARHEIEEVFGRSVYGSQFALADLQMFHLEQQALKQNTDDENSAVDDETVESKLEPTIEPDNPLMSIDMQKPISIGDTKMLTINVSSGVIILSGGAKKTPAFVAAYTDLVCPEMATERDPLALTSGLLENVKRDNVEEVINCFAAEVCLGSLASDLALDDFGFRAGFQAETLFCGGLDGLSGLNSVAASKARLLEDGSLLLQLCSSSHVEALTGVKEGSSSESRVLFQCVFRVPPVADSDDMNSEV